MAKKEKGVIPGEHWEKLYPPSAPSPNMLATKGSDFNPKRAPERKTTHLKVNVTDY